MNARERFVRLMNYEPVDGLPVLDLEPLEIEAIKRWRKEGLPEGMSHREYFGIDELHFIPIKFHPIPAFEHKVISEDAEHIIETDYMGCIVKRRKEAPSMFYGFIDHPVKSRRDWEAYKFRYISDFQSRRPENWGQDYSAGLNQYDNPVGINLFPFFFRLGFYLMGMEKFMEAFYDDPDLIHDMFEFWTDFVYKLIEPILGVIKVDFVLFAEDLAYKTSTHISANAYRKFWLRRQDRLMDLLHKHNVPLICLWTAGNIDPILPDLLDHGFNCTWPLERQADGMDAIELRRRYGRKLRLGGNIAKEALVKGPQAIDREIERLRPLIHQGGFLPALDDMVPPEVPLAHYRHLVEKLRSIKM